jgi:Family of unknown function (DUF5681)
MDEQTDSVLVPPNSVTGNSEQKTGIARSLANLRPWRPGQSGNPQGRPKKLITEATREWLAKVDESTGLTNAQMVAKAQVEQAIKGETAAYNAVADRTEGKVIQPIAGDADGNPISIEFIGLTITTGS